MLRGQQLFMMDHSDRYFGATQNEIDTPRQVNLSRFQSDTHHIEISRQTVTYLFKQTGQ